MRLPGSGSYEPLSVAEKLRVEEVCDAFEIAWKEKASPRIEDFVQRITGPAQTLLLEELIALDIDYRRQLPDTLSLDGYRQRFPSVEPDRLASLLTANHDLSGIATATPPAPSTDSTSSASPDLGIPTSLGDYDLLGEIARGGMGVVYKARQRSLKRLVAVKLILSGEFASEKERQRFQVEAEAAARLDHPHIVPIYEIGTHAGRCYLAMKLIEGRSLAQTVAKNEWAAIDAEQQTTIAQMIATIARTVHYAHQHGILHRDLKPSNILLDTQGQPYLTDFGLAKQMDEKRDMTGSGAILGTPAYIAPEAASGSGQATTAVDIYALGVILYELLTGRPPFHEGGPMQILRQVINDEPEALRRRHPRIVRDLEIICLKCLCKQPSARFGSAEELAEDLERFARGEPILTRPARAWERTWRWCRRKPALASMVGLAAVLALLLFVGVLTATFIYRNQRDSLDGAFVELHRQSKETEAERDKARTAEKGEREKRAEALLKTAQAGRWSGKMGRRFDGLQAISEAATLLQSLDLSQDTLRTRLLQLRNEAIACMALPDFRVAKTIKSMVPQHGPAAFDFDPQLLHFAQRENDEAISVWRVDDNRQLARLFRPGGAIRQVRFSSDGRFLATLYSELNHISFCVWNPRTSDLILETPLSTQTWRFDFSPDSAFLALETTEGPVHVFDLATKKVIKKLARTSGAALEHVRFSPDGKKLAISAATGNLEIWDWQTEKLLRLISDDRRTDGIDWSPDGNFVAVAGADGTACVWRVASGEKTANLKSHKHHVFLVAFHPTGRFLVTASWDGTTRFWDISAEQELLRMNESFVRFSPDGKRAGFATSEGFEIREVNLAEEARHLQGHGNKVAVHDSECSPNGRLLATCGHDGVRLWDTNSWREVGFVASGKNTRAAFHPGKDSLLVSSSTMSQEWPIQWPSNQANHSGQLGPPIPLPAGGGAAPGRIVISADGQWSVRHSEQSHQLVIYDSKCGTAIRTEKAGSFIRNFDISPDGQWLASGTHLESGPVVSETSTGKVTKRLPAVGWNGVAFSPDGKWLATTDNKDVRFWHVGSWELSHVYDSPGLGSLRFSPDGATLAVGKITASREPNAIHLIEAATGQLLAKLENTPAPTQIEDIISFTPDGRYLVVPHFKDGVFCIWDLARIRAQLKEMHLDWDKEPYPEPRSPGVEITALKIDLGPLKYRPIQDLIKGKKYQHALDAASKELDETSKDSELWYLRGRALYELRQDKKALADFNRALSFDGNHLESYHYRGHAYASLNRYREALQDFEQAARRSTSDPHLHDMIGQYHYLLQEYVPAAVAWQRSLDLKKDQPSPCHRLASIHVLGPEKLRDPAKALPLAERALQLARADQRLAAQIPDYQNTLGIVYYRLDRLKDAVKTLEEAAGGKKEQPLATNRFVLSMAYHRLGDRKKAKECYEQALAWRKAQLQLSTLQTDLLDRLQTEATDILRKLDNDIRP